MKLNEDEDKSIAVNDNLQNIFLLCWRFESYKQHCSVHAAFQYKTQVVFTRYSFAYFNMRRLRFIHVSSLYHNERTTC